MLEKTKTQKKLDCAREIVRNIGELLGSHISRGFHMWGGSLEQRQRRTKTRTHKGHKKTGVSASPCRKGEGGGRQAFAGKGQSGKTHHAKERKGSKKKIQGGPRPVPQKE